MSNKERKIRILKIEPKKLPYEKEISNNLSGIQKEVEGIFICVYLDDNCILVCNDEGKMNGMELNRRFGRDIIAGPFFIVGNSSDGEFKSLTDGQVEKYTARFEEIQEFTGEEIEAKPWIVFLGFDL